MNKTLEVDGAIGTAATDSMAKSLNRRVQMLEFGLTADDLKVFGLKPQQIGSISSTANVRLLLRVMQCRLTGRMKMNMATD
jgi:hypothetical protein